MNHAYLLIGGNLGKIKENLQNARELIGQKVGAVSKASSLYQTAAWGLEEQPDFINQVLLVDSELPAADMLITMLDIEQVLGRVREMKNGPRLIDIDLLFYNDEVIHLTRPDLTVPHPLLHTRNFTLYPLAEIAPDFVHPVLHKKIRTLLQQSPDALPVKKL
ncbi:2-amino-4-hydroxy-6-hydroxymethyldihydropteridinediphosphokinase [Arachidicoccus rhizosphaerae]|jgi:2-amino-4-hydroxy-6-hydroxymethyldihydropteridine diphosphokinase|uniref:2-amino-4-hydroxy-6-hydroxymethyldihydropteridine pyrophosphokinase n=1 Tax=Arachidicoccus rhizosphaerae TaxID=551991 RepID=A0A1H4CY37_9BACT|nr:2-amino-4-hydroxy-6-hydroxymethyldihydropteridine diphosphokinase [Arachidicoccus rhizosphaerae]SEA65307.1 2-amino-4-hydroxy-6-hydroxymethyldihydropteridinediphosphokinase [Arachidicoccus rhizosphaerae]